MYRRVNVTSTRWSCLDVDDDEGDDEVGSSALLTAADRATTAVNHAAMVGRRIASPSRCPCDPPNKRTYVRQSIDGVTLSQS